MTPRSPCPWVCRRSLGLATLLATAFILSCGGSSNDGSNGPVAREAGRMSVASQEAGDLPSRTAAHQSPTDSPIGPDRQSEEGTGVAKRAPGEGQIAIPVEPGAAPDDVREELSEYLSDVLGVEVDPGGIDQPSSEMDRDPTTDFMTLSPLEDTDPSLPAGTDITPPKIVEHVNPVYTDDARKARAQGNVMLQVAIDPTGEVTDVRVLHSIPLLDQAAIDAVKQWKFEPALLEGQPVSFDMTVTVNFTLP